MTQTQTASERITEAATAWPGVQAGYGDRSEFSFKVGKREIGHLHGDRAAHFGFPKEIWRELYDAGRIDYHPVSPARRAGARAGSATTRTSSTSSRCCGSTTTASWSATGCRTEPAARRRA